jgi:Rps23 Pro-64 3,4-dihydroxylase Tpa1-like proline 4-hydroxylase
MLSRVRHGRVLNMSLLSSVVRERRSLSQVLSPTVLNGFRAGLVGRLETGPASLRWRLADIDRALGDFDAAASGYEACADAGDPSGKWVAALMRGEAGAPPAWNGASRPAPFLCLYDFLAPEELRNARALIASRREKLRRARIGSDRSLRVDLDVRSAYSAGAGSELTALLARRVFAATAENILDRLGLGAISENQAEVETALVGYAAGDKYSRHKDCDGSPQRLLTLVWYIHDEPKAFTGGDLLLYDDAAPDGSDTAVWFTRIVPVRNMALLFPSNRWHEVTPVLSSPDDVMAGRLAINLWFAAAQHAEGQV